MDHHTELSKIILYEAKRQYYAGEIAFKEYEQILTLLYYKLSNIECDMAKKKYIMKVFSMPFRVNLLETINYSLSMN
jgi:hypothetical protein